MGSISERVARRTALIRRADEMTPAEWETYKKKHPDADPAKHKIVKPQTRPGKPELPGTFTHSKAPAAPATPRPSQSTEPKPQAKKPPPIPEAAKKTPSPPQQPNAPAAKTHEAPHEGEHEGWRKTLKNLKESAVKFVESTPRAVKSFLGDPDLRKAALKEARDSLVKLPKDARHRLVETVKEEIHEFKTAGQGIKAVLSGKKMSKHQKHAFQAVAVHLAIGATAAAFAATGPLVGAATFTKNLVTHVALKSVKKALGNLHTLNEVNHIGHGVLHFLEHIASEGEKDADPEEIMVDLIFAAVAKQIEQLTDDDFTEVLNHIGDDGDADESEAPSNKQAALRVLKRFAA